MSGVDAASISGSVGGWSWQDNDATQSAGGTPMGWSHESKWIALTLTEATELTMRLEPKADIPSTQSSTGFHGGNLFPGATLWSNWQTTDWPEGSTRQNHVYHNSAVITWAPSLEYIGNIPGGAANTVHATFSLLPGTYTLVIGGNGSSVDEDPTQGFQATFTSVPEPGSALLVLLGAAFPALRRHRQSRA
jgi:hypothetical protein